MLSMIKSFLTIAKQSFRFMPPLNEDAAACTFSVRPTLTNKTNNGIKLNYSPTLFCIFDDAFNGGR
jgi:hypothetical protein